MFASGFLPENKRPLPQRFSDFCVFSFVFLITEKQSTSADF